MRGELSGGEEAICLIQEKYPASGAAKSDSDVLFRLAHVPSENIGSQALMHLLAENLGDMMGEGGFAGS